MAASNGVHMEESVLVKPFDTNVPRHEVVVLQQIASFSTEQLMSQVSLLRHGTQQSKVSPDCDENIEAAG